MKFFVKPLVKSIVGHLSIWAIWLAMQIYMIQSINQPVNTVVIIQLLGHSVELAILIYCNLWVLIPAFLDKKRYFLYALSAIVFLAAVSFVSIHLNLGITHTKDMRQHLIGAGFYMLIGTLIGLYHRSIVTNKQLREQQLTAELELLKAQINPHFFFNTLNSIYSLSLVNPEKTSAAILQLSNLMHYMFKIARLKNISLDQEIDYINTYMALEKMRFGEKCETAVNVSGKTGDIQLPPLLLLPFIENAFKHGAELAAGKSFVRMDVAVQKNELFVQVSNSMGEGQPNRQNSGTGLMNVKKRLALSFRNRFELHIICENGIHIITLRLQIH